MHSRAARLMLCCLFVAAISVAGFLFWKGEGLMHDESARAAALDSSARRASQSLRDVRAAQFAYVAAGQGTDYWTTKAARDLDSARSAIKTLRQAITSPPALAALQSTESIVEDVARVDKRAIDHVRNGQRLLASDVIFSDGVELSEAALASLDQALGLELQSRDALLQTFRRRQLFALVAGAAAAVLSVLLLIPAAPASRSRQRDQHVAIPPEVSAAGRGAEGWSAPRRASVPEPKTQAPAEPPETIPIESGREAVIEAVPIAQSVSSVVTTTDFPGLALLCLDLARISDTRALPGLLDRAATLLDASGIILWIADPDGRELNPIFAQGYPQQLVNRLGTIPKEAENATAAAFRTSLLQTVMADEISPGAIAAPLVTPNGCVGVMAAEVRNEAERQELTLAAATIVAAQLATLVGPPSARPHAKSGSASA